MKNIYSILLCTIVFVGCKEATNIKAPIDTEPKEMMVGGACSYNESTEKIKIIAIDETKSKNICQNSVKIKYKLIDQTAVKNINYKVSKEYMTTKGFTVGTTQIIKTSTIKSGTCTPIIKEIIGLDKYTFQKECRDIK